MVSETNPEVELIPTWSDAELLWIAWSMLHANIRKIWKVREFYGREEVEQALGPIRHEVLYAYLKVRLGLSTNQIAKSPREVPTNALHPNVVRRFEPIDWALVHALADAPTHGTPLRNRASALSNLVLWRFGDESQSVDAIRRLTRFGLPRDPQWLYLVVRALARSAHEIHLPVERRFFWLVSLFVNSGLNDLASWLIGLFFVKRYDSWWFGDLQPNMIRACDRAGLEFQPLNFPWFRLAARAASEGRLSHTWLEPLVGAALRCSEEPERSEYLHFHRQRRYEVTPKRLQRLHEASFLQIRGGDARVASDLFGHALELKATNPYRAMRLLELALEHVYGRSIGVLLESEFAISDPLIHHLVALYVSNLELDANAMRATNRLRTAVDWSRFGLSDTDFDRFELVSDYGRAFSERRVSFQGLEIEHCDKEGAAFVHYFRTKRSSAGTITRWIHDLDLPEWGAVQLSEDQRVDGIFGALMNLIMEATQRRQREIVSEFQKHGVQIDAREQIASLPSSSISRVAWYARHRAILAAALAGGVAGGLAPYTNGLSAVVDAPFVMVLTCEICIAACEYYGFDPAEDPELPKVILAVALMGSSPDSYDHKAVNERFHRFMFRKSLFLAASSHGQFQPLINPLLVPVLNSIARRRYPLKPWELLKNRARPVYLPSSTSPWLAGMGAVAGAVLNLALVYDLTEAAHAVLLDRFLARKYDGWQGTW